MIHTSPQEFLERCSESSHTAYDLLKKLLDYANTGGGRTEVRRFLTHLRKQCEESELSFDDFIARHHFSFNTLALSHGNGTENTLSLLQLPSIFTPEDWSFTFFEGLARYPVSEFQGRVVAELGCGNGWISIALAAKTLPQKIIGLDINPRAITCARLNLLLNALDDSGIPIVDHDGKSLLERVEFHVSDLLGYPIKQGIQLDRVIGCIPQVLSPEPLLAAQFVSEEADDNFLYALSNYCEKQGYIEDQFGLGLIARALEESISITKPSAKVILNLGGRPGTAVLERLLSRRGFSVHRIWSTKVWQAVDTDILPLVEIENITPHRFEFFTSLTSDEPIGARTALEYQKKGGQIAHSLSVYEAQIKFPSAIRSIFKLISQNGFEDSRSGHDLAFESEELAEEKINFIGNLAEWLQQKSSLPYSDTEGEPQLRRQIAQFLRSYWKIPLTAKSVFIIPNRKTVLKNYTQLLNPSLTLIQKDLAPHLPLFLLNSEITSQHSAPKIVEAPKRVDEICKLALALKPQLVICSLQDFEVRTSDAFVRLVEICTRVKAQLIVDMSEHFELSSQPLPHGVLSYISEHPLPEHVTLLFALIRNRVYSDLELAFIISENKSLLDRMTAAAELTYSRTPLLTQRYFGKIFGDLLNFQLTDLRRSKTEKLRLPHNRAGIAPLPLPQNIEKAFNHPAVVTQRDEITPQHIRLDYGENCLDSPVQLDSAIIESYLRQNISANELNCEKPIVELVRKRFGMNHLSEKNVVLGLGVAPLFCAALELIASKQQAIALPSGAYGYFKAACDYLNVPCNVIGTSEKNCFKMTAAELDQFLSQTHCHWLYLNAPIVNPTGAIYTRSEMRDVFDVIRKYDCGIILDTIFSGLEFNERHSNLNLNELSSASSEKQNTLRMIMLGGLSKELAAGGLRFGWAISDNDEITQGLKSRATGVPHTTVRYTAKKVYQALNDDRHAIHKELDKQRVILKSRAEKLSHALTELGWDVLEARGGLFVCASPKKYLDNYARTMEEHDYQHAADEIAAQLRVQTGLLVNSATWTGLSHHLRFVISVDEDTLAEGIVSLKQFDLNWQNQHR